MLFALVVCDGEGCEKAVKMQPSRPREPAVPEGWTRDPIFVRRGRRAHNFGQGRVKHFCAECTKKREASCDRANA